MIALSGLTWKYGILGKEKSIGISLFLLDIWNIKSLWSFTLHSPNSSIFFGANLTVGQTPRPVTWIITLSSFSPLNSNIAE